MALKKYFSIVFASIAGALLILSAISIDTFFMEDNRCFAGTNDIFYKMFGQFRSSIAAILYIKADKHFHGGTSHAKGHEGHSCLGAKMKSCRQENSNEKHSVLKDNKDIFSILNRAIFYKPVQHLNVIESAEIMPWFELAVLADPYYIRAYTVGGFWLGMRLGKQDKALRFLRKGLRYNPRAWEIYAQIGDTYFIMDKDYVKAIAYFRQAYLFMKSSDTTNIEQRHILTLLAASFERLKKYGKSVYYYKKILDLYPHDKSLQARINKLERLESGEEKAVFNL